MGLIISGLMKDLERERASLKNDEPYFTVVLHFLNQGLDKNKNGSYLSISSKNN